MESTRRHFLGASAGTAVSALSQPPKSSRPAGPRFFVASVTPVDRVGKLDEPLVRDLMAFFREQGVDGVLVLGTTGEFSAFSLAERKKILESYMRVKGSLEAMCHIATPNLPETLELLEHATGSGVDLALCLPPFYVKNPPQEGLERYFAAVLEKARIPVLVYNIPAMSGITITHELLRKLERYDKLYGVKDSTGKLESTTAYIQAFPKLKIFGGSSGILEPTLKIGAAGAITANGNILARETAAVMRSFREGKDASAALARLDAVHKITGPFESISGMKYALGLMGLREGCCRPPLVDVAESRKAEIKALVAQWKQLNA